MITNTDPELLMCQALQVLSIWELCEPYRNRIRQQLCSSPFYRLGNWDIDNLACWPNVRAKPGFKVRRVVPESYSEAWHYRTSVLCIWGVGERKGKYSLEESLFSFSTHTHTHTQLWRHPNIFSLTGSSNIIFKFLFTGQYLPRDTWRSRKAERPEHWAGQKSYRSLKRWSRESCPWRQGGMSDPAVIQNQAAVWVPTSQIQDTYESQPFFPL